MDYKGSLNTQASAAGCEILAPLCSESPSLLDMKGLTGDCGGSWAGLDWARLAWCPGSGHCEQGRKGLRVKLEQLRSLHQKINKTGQETGFIATSVRLRSLSSLRAPISSYDMDSNN